MRRGVLDPARMEETLGGMIGELSTAPSEGLRVYGEIVELCAEEGNFEQACALEDYWNHLQQRYRFTLLCGYSAAHFAGPDRAERRIRQLTDAHADIEAFLDQRERYVGTAGSNRSADQRPLAP